ncbi:MAG: hypothetical protein LW878_04645, partial [Proteobacteria bacterium]|nr:hypothetical protein [Pseudomonadota bacterium]
MSARLFVKLLDGAKASRLKDIVIDKLNCMHDHQLGNPNVEKGQYGVQRELIGLTSCSCSGGNEECYSLLRSLGGSISGTVRYYSHPHPHPHP